MAYAIRRCSDDRVIGMSTYYTELLSQRGVSIGTSFLHPSVRGGPANPEAKLLMLDHAFGCGAVRVQFKVDTRNQRSQAAVAKLGAFREGVIAPGPSDLDRLHSRHRRVLHPRPRMAAVEGSTPAAGGQLARGIMRPGWGLDLKGDVFQLKPPENNHAISLFRFAFARDPCADCDVVARISAADLAVAGSRHHRERRRRDADGEIAQRRGRQADHDR
jgi:hypothetical protein